MPNFNTIAYYKFEFLSYKDWYNYHMHYHFRDCPFYMDWLNMKLLANVVRNRTIEGMYCNYFQI